MARLLRTVPPEHVDRLLSLTSDDRQWPVMLDNVRTFMTRLDHLGSRVFDPDDFWFSYDRPWADESFRWRVWWTARHFRDVRMEVVLHPGLGLNIDWCGRTSITTLRPVTARRVVDWAALTVRVNDRGWMENWVRETDVYKRAVRAASAWRY